MGLLFHCLQKNIGIYCVLIWKIRSLYIIMGSWLKLWLIGNRTSCSPIQFSLERNVCLFVFQGYLVAWCEQDSHLSIVLLKYFGKHSKEDWMKETNIVERVVSKSETLSSVLSYRWHSKGKNALAVTLYLLLFFSNFFLFSFLLDEL